jgi:hypothetical protein
MQTVLINKRFCGPPNSGNGGYSCGITAQHINGPSQVRLYSPPPLDSPMRLQESDNGWSLMHGDQLVGRAVPAKLDLEVPAAPSLAQAMAARESCPQDEARNFTTCFVCGPSRLPGDGLRLFSGCVDGDKQLVACDWTPSPDLLDAEGNVAAEYIWSALDCPSFFALGLGEDLVSLLAQMTCAIDKPVPGGQPLVVYAWKQRIDGRKGFSAAALSTAEGEILARAEHLWIQVKP